MAVRGAEDLGLAARSSGISPLACTISPSSRPRSFLASPGLLPYAHCTGYQTKVPSTCSYLQGRHETIMRLMDGCDFNLWVPKG